MATIRQINATLDESRSLELISQAYSEIASMKLKRIRSGIERNRAFSQELANIYHTIKLIALEKGLSRVKNKGVVCLLLTSNQHFYGDLEMNLSKYFLSFVTKHKCYKIIIGKVAQEFLGSTSELSSSKQLLFQKDLPNHQEINQLNSILSGYNQILVFHNRIKSLLLQEPSMTDISQTPSSRTPLKKVPVDYILEPEVNKMLEFFDSQITFLLLEQTFFEAELARTSSRLTAMDEAQSNAKDQIKGQMRAYSQALDSIGQEKLLETVAALKAFRKEPDANYYLT